MQAENHPFNVDVLHVIGAFAAGGAERFVVDLLRTLNQQGLSVGLLALSAKEDAAGRLMRQSLKHDGIPFQWGPTERVGARSLAWYLKRLIEIRPQIVHLHTPNTELAHFLASKVYRKKHALFRTLHNTHIPDKAGYWKAIHKNSATISIACSEPVRGRFAPVLKGKIVTIENGINFDWPVQTPTIQKQHQEKLRLSHDHHHFLNIGRQGGESPESAQKAHDVLIKAWKHGGLGQHGCLLHLLGDGNLRNALEQLATGDNSILFHGTRSDVHDWLLAADCFVMPSRHEGLPIAGIEAAGSGLPCIFSDIPPLHALSAPAVLWTAVDDYRQLAAKLVEMAENKAVVPQDATEKLRRNFGIEKTAALYHKCYIPDRS